MRGERMRLVVIESWICGDELELALSGFELSKT